MVTVLSCLRYRLIATGSNDSTVKIWQEAHIEFKSLESHNEAIYSIVILQNGDFATGSVDSTIKIWNQNEVIKTLSVALKILLLKFGIKTLLHL